MKTQRHGGGGTSAISLLERRHLPVSVSRIAEYESWRKERHRPATYVHKWWARRLGSVLRSVLLAASSTGGKRPRWALTGTIVYDPFGGAGTTLVEAVKLGARVVARDINPVATLTQRQALQAWNFDTVEQLFATVEASCRADIEALYVTADGEPVLHYFWVAIADCPDCREPVELFSNYVFAKHAYPSRHPTAQATCPYCHAVCPADATADTQGRCPRCHLVFGFAGPVRERTMTCSAGHRSYITAALAQQIPRRRMYAKMVKTADGAREYREIDKFDLDLYDRAAKLLADANVADIVTPEGTLTDGANTIQALRWGYRTWASFFNNRQLYCLGRIAAALRDLPGHSPEREALIAVFGKTVEHHNTFCSFKGEGTGPVRSIFHNHVLRPERCSVEGNPWGTHGGSGGYADALARLRRAHNYKLDPTDLTARAGTINARRGLSAPIQQAIVSCWDDFAANPGSAYVVTGDGGQTDIPTGAVTLVGNRPALHGQRPLLRACRLLPRMAARHRPLPRIPHCTHHARRTRGPERQRGDVPYDGRRRVAGMCAGPIGRWAAGIQLPPVTDLRLGGGHAITGRRRLHRDGGSACRGRSSHKPDQGSGVGSEPHRCHRRVPQGWDTPQHRRHRPRRDHA